MKHALTAVSVLFATTGACFAQNAERPDVIEFGASVADMETALADKCSSIETRETDPFMPIHEKQHQIDCEGFEYFGAPRSAEFVFGDDALIIVWILTGKKDEAALESAFTAQYGTPTHISDDFTAYADHNAAVRKDTPEALFYSPAISPQYRAFFDAQSVPAE